MSGSPAWVCAESCLGCRGRRVLSGVVSRDGSALFMTDSVPPGSQGTLPTLSLSLCCCGWAGAGSVPLLFPELANRLRRGERGSSVWMRAKCFTPLHSRDVPKVSHPLGYKRTGLVGFFHPKRGPYFPPCCYGHSKGSIIFAEVRVGFRGSLLSPGWFVCPGMPSHRPALQSSGCLSQPPFNFFFLQFLRLGKHFFRGRGLPLS